MSCSPPTVPYSAAMSNEKGATCSPSYQPSDIEMGTIYSTEDKHFRFSAWAKKLSVETGGIQRVTDAERLQNTTHVWNACTFWWAQHQSLNVSRMHC